MCSVTRTKKPNPSLVFPLKATKVREWFKVSRGVGHRQAMTSDWRIFILWPRKHQDGVDVSNVLSMFLKHGDFGKARCLKEEGIRRGVAHCLYWGRCTDV